MIHAADTMKLCICRVRTAAGINHTNGTYPGDPGLPGGDAAGVVRETDDPRDLADRSLVQQLRTTILDQGLPNTQTRLRNTIHHGVLELVKENIQEFGRYHLPYLAESAYY